LRLINNEGLNQVFGLDDDVLEFDNVSFNQEIPENSPIYSISKFLNSASFEEI